LADKLKVKRQKSKGAGIKGEQRIRLLNLIRMKLKENKGKIQKEPTNKHPKRFLNFDL